MGNDGERARGYIEAQHRIAAAQRTRATEIHLVRLSLTTLPPEIGSLTALQRLYLHYNQLATLPPEIGSLTELQRLYLHYNQLATLPPAIGSLTALRAIDLRSNQIATLPPAIGSLTALQRLDLRNNQLATLPSEIGSLTALQRLDLDNNRLATLPPAIGSLTALQALYVNSNRLTTLPPVIGSLTALQTLDLSDNQLATLPLEIGGLKALQSLYLHDNPGLGLPPEVLGATWEEVGRNKAEPKAPGEILAYYFASLDGKALRELKLILVGRGGVGKSSMADALQGKRFVKNRKSTDGIAITPWDAELKDGPATLRIWDFGGQEIMHGTHQFFLTHRCLYVVIVDNRDDRGKKDAAYWLKLVRAFGGDSRVLVVMNKQKEIAFDLDRQDLATKHGVSLDHFFPTDCQAAGTITPLRKAILKEAHDTLATRERFPRKWWEIKKALADMEEDYLSDEDYRELCEEHEITDGGEQDRLLSDLTDLGMVSSFPKDERLSELTVLNPEWATEGVYRIITNEPLREEKHGKLELGRLKELLPKDRWPKPAHRTYVIDLMKKFDLCFDADGDDEAVIVPALLKDETPPLTHWDAKACVVLVYEYPVLHHGILPRFISRTNTHSQGRLRWRSGVELEADGAEALVKADYDSNRVSVWIRGPHANTTRAMFSVIRREFGVIHAKIKDLNPVEGVGVPGYPDVTVPYADLVQDEQGGRETIRVTLDGRRRDVSISEMLDGVQSKAERTTASLTRAAGSVTYHDNRIIIDGDVREGQVAHKMRRSRNQPKRSGGTGDGKEG